MSAQRKINIGERWKKYVARKSRLALIFDILFFVLLLALLFPATRRSIMSTVTRYTLFSPRELSDVYYVPASTYDWKLVNAQGDTLKLSDFKGEVLLVNFWATWCPPCVAEFPTLQNLYNEQKSHVKFILVTDEPFDVVDKFMVKHHYNIPVYRSVDGVPQSLSSPSVPTTFILSKDGRMVVKKVGSAKWDSSKVSRLINNLVVAK